MTDEGARQGSPDDGGLDGPPSMPGWVKSLLLILLAVALVAVLVMLLSGGEHGPSRHGALGTDAQLGFRATPPTRP